MGFGGTEEKAAWRQKNGINLKMRRYLYFIYANSWQFDVFLSSFFSHNHLYKAPIKHIPGLRFLLEFDLASSICKTDPVWGSNFTPWLSSRKKLHYTERKFPSIVNTLSVNYDKLIINCNMQFSYPLSILFVSKQSDKIKQSVAIYYER